MQVPGQPDACGESHGCQGQRRAGRSVRRHLTGLHFFMALDFFIALAKKAVQQPGSAIISRSTRKKTVNLILELFPFWND